MTDHDLARWADDGGCLLPVNPPPAPVPVAMDAYTATMIAEGVEEADEERQIEAWQYLVDTGLAWRLQGTFGRTAAAMIEAGLLSHPAQGRA